MARCAVLIYICDEGKAAQVTRAFRARATFGQRFGPADSDVQAAQAWLISKGLAVIGCGGGMKVVQQPPPPPPPPNSVAHNVVVTGVASNRITRTAKLTVMAP